MFESGDWCQANDLTNRIARCAWFFVLLFSGTSLGCARVQSPSASPSSAFQQIAQKQTLNNESAKKFLSSADATLALVFASWCGPCRAELQIAQRLAKAEPRLSVIGINYYEAWGGNSDETRLRAFVADHAPGLHVVSGDQKLLMALGGVPKIPSAFLFDKHGRLVAAWRRHERAVPTEEELKQAIANVLGRY